VTSTGEEDYPMADIGWFRSRTAGVTGTGVLLALLASSVTAPAHAAPEVAPAAVGSDCPTAVPVASVTTGMTGEGLTVVTGSTPQPFDVEVLGVLPDGIGAGHDMIMIKVSDQPGRHVVDQGGGIWAGMSGSPVYVGGQLLGAVSYGFTAAPSTIGGLTPAADMLDLLGLRGAAAARAGRTAKPKAALKLSVATRRKLAVQAATAAPQGTLQPLVTPLAVSGLRPTRIRRLQAATDAAGLGLKAYSAGRASAAVATAPTARPQPGGNFGAVLSYGDLTAAGIGTTTAVCGNQAVAFGHPLAFAGPARYGANDGNALAIIKDETLGSFKMANLAAPLGKVDQDRFTGVRADLTALPALADVTTVIRNRDTGKSRTGTTRVADPASLSGLLPFAAVANFDAVFDEVGDGTATSQWTITGTRAGGLPFSLSRSNQWADRSDLAFAPAFDLAAAADQLLNNEFENVTIDSVAFGSTVATRYQQLHITNMAVSVNGGKYSSAKRLNAKVGAKLRIRVSLQPYRGTTTTTTTLNMTVPKKARGQSGELAAVGGVELAQGFGESFDEGCFFTGDCEEESFGSLNAIMKDITGAPRNDAVVAQLSLDSQDEEGTSTPAASTTRLQNLTVAGVRSITLNVRR
jgi:hypothetical protein